METNIECPICRKNLSFEKMRFITNPQFDNFIKSLVYDFKILIVCDSLWFDRFLDNKLVNKNKNSIRILHQTTFIDGSLNNDKNLKNVKDNKIVLINLSGLSDKDLEFTNKNYNYFKNMEIANLVE